MKAIVTLILLGCGIATYAQQQPVPVSQEPRHHKVLENEWVRVLDVRIPPGDTSLIHVHATPSAFLVLTSVRTGSQTLVEPGVARSNSGMVWFEGFYTGPRVHRVWNSDTTEFHVIDMELVHAAADSVASAARARTAVPVYGRLIFDERPAVAYGIQLPAGKELKLAAGRTPGMLISLADLKKPLVVAGKVLAKKGDFVFIPAGVSVAGVNKNASEASLAFFRFYN